MFLPTTYEFLYVDDSSRLPPNTEIKRRLGWSARREINSTTLLRVEKGYKQPGCFRRADIHPIRDGYNIPNGSSSTPSASTSNQRCLPGTLLFKYINRTAYAIYTFIVVSYSIPFLVQPLAPRASIPHRHMARERENPQAHRWPRKTPTNQTPLFFCSY